MQDAGQYLIGFLRVGKGNTHSSAASRSNLFTCSRASRTAARAAKRALSASRSALSACIKLFRAVVMDPSSWCLVSKPEWRFGEVVAMSGEDERRLWNIDVRRAGGDVDVVGEVRVVVAGATGSL